MEGKEKRTDEDIGFEQLRRVRDGESSLSLYKVCEEKICDELSEDEYETRMKRRRMEDEFVVDDDGAGYIEGNYCVEDHREYECSDDSASENNFEMKKSVNFIHNINHNEPFSWRENASTQIKKIGDDIFNDLVDNLRTRKTFKPQKTQEEHIEDILIFGASQNEKRQIDGEAYPYVFGNNVSQNVDDFNKTDTNLGIQECIYIEQEDHSTHKNDIYVKNSPKPIPEFLKNEKDSILDKSCSGKSYLVFWMDIYEKSNGNVYIIGKTYQKETNTYVTCCVIVENIMRELYLLPNADSDVSIVQLEIEGLLFKKGYQNVKYENVRKKYHFRPYNIPDEAEYLKVSYPYKYPTIPLNIERKHFSHVFGSSTSAFEFLVLKRKLFGPCWLLINNSRISERHSSWTKLEIVVHDMMHINVVEDKAMKNPKFMFMSVGVQTMPNKQENEIFAINVHTWKSMDLDDLALYDLGSCGTGFSMIRPFGQIDLPEGLQEYFLEKASHKIEICQNERSLLNLFIATVYRIDPDFILGHNILGYDLNVILSRMRANGTERWSRIGRLNWSVVHKNQTHVLERNSFIGRLVCDSYVLGKEFIKSKTYSLKDLSMSQLNVHIEGEINVSSMMLDKSADDWIKLTDYMNYKSVISMRLIAKVMILPLTLQLSRLCGGLWSHTLLGFKSERNEYLLLHEFHKKDILYPDKSIYKGNVDFTRKKASYSGGLVLEPKSKFYDQFVLLLDFNSLYPSLIQESNVCFTTYRRSPNIMDDITDEFLSTFSFSSEEHTTGILPSIIRNLITERKAIKNQLDLPNIEPCRRLQLDIEQKALKLTANSIYGCLGSPLFRFYTPLMASFITYQGRQVLQKTVGSIAKEFQLEVIYGDTDSVMVSTGTTNYSDAKRLAYLIKVFINKTYRNIELDVECLFKKLLLLRKKKYAALIYEEIDGKANTRIEVKGLEIVRRDWCELAVNSSNFVLREILSEKPGDHVAKNIYSYLTDLCTRVRDKKCDIAEFIIHKNLIRNPEDYADAHNHPHVQVALRMKTSGRPVCIGDIIPYVISNKNTSSLAHRAYHINEFKENEELKVDTEWYIKQQIFPPISRICHHFPQVSFNMLSQCMGLGFKISDYEDTSEGFVLSEKNVVSTEFPVRCPKCFYVFKIASLVVDYEDTRIVSWTCVRCQHVLGDQCLYNQLCKFIRNLIDCYYQCWMRCDEIECGLRTRESFQSSKCMNLSCSGNMVQEYSEVHLYNDLSHMKKIFDLSCSKTVFDFSDSQIRLIGFLQETVKDFISYSSYSVVNLSRLLYKIPAVDIKVLIKIPEVQILSR